MAFESNSNQFDPVWRTDGTLNDEFALGNNEVAELAKAVQLKTSRVCFHGYPQGQCPEAAKRGQTICKVSLNSGY